MVHGVVRSIITQPLLSPPCYNTCGINLVLLTACILTTNLQIAIPFLTVVPYHQHKFPSDSTCGRKRTLFHCKWANSISYNIISRMLY